MSLFPFTQKGVQEKLEELYDLTDTLLSFETDTIESNFAGWMLANFDLDTAQRNYLDGIAEEARKYYSAQCALCLRHRLDIILLYPSLVPDYA